MTQNIKSINITGLFGEHDHQINFLENVHVIMGPNGVGKTCILALLHALYSGDVLKLFDIKYQRIEITYSSGEKIEVDRIGKEDGDYLALTKFDKEGHIIESSANISDKGYIRDVMRFKDSDEYGDVVLPNRGRRIVDFKLMEREKLFIIENIPRYNVLHLLRKDLQTQYIPAQRLQMNIDNKRVIERINYISREVEKKLVSTTEEVAKKSNMLDQTFPERLLEVLGDNKIIFAKRRLYELIDEIKKDNETLLSVGITSTAQTSLTKYIVDRKIKEKHTLKVLGLYLRDYLEKIQSYIQLANKLQLFLGTLSEHFLNKKLVIGANKKLTALSTITHEEIPLDRLSSGEQNELILFYYLIFECDEKHLVLIDEPEISLHIAWLDKLLPIFRKIASENNLQMLIATHSPDFVGSNTDILQILSEE